MLNPLSINKAQDIWDFGVLAAQCLFGLDVMRKYRYPALLLAEGTFQYLILSLVFNADMAVAQCKELR